MLSDRPHIGIKMMSNANMLKARFFEGISNPASREELLSLARRCAAAGSKVTAEDRIDIAAALAHTAFLAPDKTVETYDALAEGWLGGQIDARPIKGFDRPPEPVPEGLCDAYWAIVEDGLAGKLDALSITQRTAGLGKWLTAETKSRIAEMSHMFEGVTVAASGPMPPLIKLSTLAACPEGSLGREFHDLIVDNKFDLEVLDRVDIGVEGLPDPLAYLNTRMLQAHDLWHITAGYETTALDEVAISAFQMAQFGHNYSAQFLSITGVISALSPGIGYRYLMDTITSAWVHGRNTPPMILIPWERVWDQPVDQIRSTYGVAPYQHMHPADLVERGQIYASKLYAISQVFVRIKNVLFGRVQARGV
jgi:ubiquinone biosynthesis protein Coq4